MDSLLFWLVPAASVLALCFAYYFHKQMMKESAVSYTHLTLPTN